MPSSETELEERLKEAGNSLLNPPSSVDDLLDILDDESGANKLVVNPDPAGPKTTYNIWVSDAYISPRPGNLTILFLFSDISLLVKIILSELRNWHVLLGTLEHLSITCMRKYGCLTIAGQHEFSSISLKLEHLLANVEQAPSRSMQDALLPPMKALISSAILRHLDEDVRVAVASCMSEIARITAPDAPYNDDLMKEIFQLTVASFEKLSHESGHCYTKAVSILENVARVRSCLMMLDLELDELILDMFQYFLKFIRSNHPQIAILAMETIMTLVIDESEEISVEILTLLLASVNKQNQSFSPIAWKLGERVITNCAAKIKPYLKEAMQSAGIPLDEYAPIVAFYIPRRVSHTQM
ncbi:hypothetical protein OIU77_026637 [Salix suchowensis]|uniref:Uncharacterized protein n=1 Tax=Salix suchowensis TaxID=1278906 RepID=A0ABQ9BLS8_9ROSI|nr:hypothetical protein OIU77_026637 [Salix suchowensis]